MEYTIFAGAVLILAIGFPHWEPAGLFGSSVGQNRLLGLTAIVGHLGGTALIGWMGGFGAGAGAFLAIPVAASVTYSLIVHPLTRWIRAKRRSPAPRIHARQSMRQP